MNVTIVYNSKSGSALNAAALRTLCDDNNIKIDQLVPIGQGFEKKLSSTIKNGGQIIAVGGDGTISAVAGLVAGTKATLIPMPGGTLNNFTKTLRVDQDIEKAFAHLPKAKVRSIDIASVNGRYFINNSSMGLYPRSLRHRAQFEDAIGKWPAAGLGVVKALFRFRSYQVSIGDEQFKTPFVFVGNNDYKIEDLDGATRDRLDAGLLSVYIVKSSRRFDLVKIFVASLFKKLDTLDSLEIRKVPKIIINTKKVRAVSVSYDGEVGKITAPLTYEIHKKSLRVLY